ncbi:hypothetical protein [Microbulbifer pacificus]|uniref:hypothetical protein n=1 Tax=Microbulbifer pacificus TaxID=407164 RepID=UPI00131A0501|nr:hypothetical protein [Microbulbifer pacificus]
MGSKWKLVLATLAVSYGSGAFAISTGAMRELKNESLLNGLYSDRREEIGLLEIHRLETDIYKLTKLRASAIKAQYNLPADERAEVLAEIVGILGEFSLIDDADYASFQKGQFSLSKDDAKDIAKLADQMIEDKSNQIEQQKRQHKVELKPLDSLAGVSFGTGDNAISPKLSFYKWDSGVFKEPETPLKDVWHWGYGVNLDLGAGNVSKTAEEAADDLMLEGGDGRISIEGAVGYQFNQNLNISIGATVNQSWLNADIEEDGQKYEVDDSARQVTANIILETQFFYLGLEHGWNKFVGDGQNRFAEAIDGNETTRVSFLVSLQDYYIRFDSMKGESGTVNSVSLSKDLDLF